MKNTKREKIVNWALQKKSRRLSAVIAAFGYKDLKSLKFMLQRLKRLGLITYKISFSGRGGRVQLNPSQATYYNRKSWNLV